MIYVRFHNTPEGDIIAMCDSELIGKIYKEEKTELDLLTYSDFYKGDLMKEDEAELLPGISNFYTANIVGTRSVGIFLKKKIISSSDIKRIKDIPYVHVYKLI